MSVYPAPQMSQRAGKSTQHAADIVAAVLKDKGWEQADFAYHSGMSQSTLNKWMGRTVNPPEKNIARVLQAIGVDPADHGLKPVRGQAGLDDQRLEQLEAMLAHQLRVTQRIARHLGLDDS